MSLGIEVKVTRIHRLSYGDGPTRAFADISVNDALLIKGLRIVEGKKGIFVSLPREKSQDGKWYEVVRPLSQEVKGLISEVVLTAYNQNEEAGS